DETGGDWQQHIQDRRKDHQTWNTTRLQMYNPTRSMNYRNAQARASLLLLHMSLSVVCFDLAEKKRLWEYPIFGEGHRVDLNNVQVQAKADDEIEVLDAQAGTKFTIGRTTILESNYVAIVTRDGLVALDPSSKDRK